MLLDQCPVGLKAPIGQDHVRRAPLMRFAIHLAGDPDANSFVEQQTRSLRTQLKRAAQTHEILRELTQDLVRPAVLPVVARPQRARRRHAPAIGLLGIETHEARAARLQPVDEPGAGDRERASEPRVGLAIGQSLDQGTQFAWRAKRVMKADVQNAAGHA